MLAWNTPTRKCNANVRLVCLGAAGTILYVMSNGMCLKPWMEEFVFLWTVLPRTVHSGYWYSSLTLPPSGRQAKFMRMILYSKRWNAFSNSVGLKRSIVCWKQTNSLNTCQNCQRRLCSNKTGLNIKQLYRQPESYAHSTTILHALKCSLSMTRLAEVGKRISRAYSAFCSNSSSMWDPAELLFQAQCTWFGFEPFQIFRMCWQPFHE